MSCESKGHGSALSGSKRILIDQGSRQQADALLAQLREMNNAPGRIQALRKQQEEQIRLVATELRARQDAMDRSLAGVSDQTARFERQLSARLRTNADQLVRELLESADRLRKESQQTLAEQEARLQDDLIRERRQREHGQQALEGKLTEVMADRTRALETATGIAADAGLLRDAIETELPHERFAPGRLADLGRRLDMANSNLTAGMGETALAQAQELYLQLSDLRMDVQLQLQEWRAAQVTASSAITVLLDQIHIDASIDVSDALPGSQARLDVDFWSEGALADLTATVRQLADRVASQESPPELAKLQVIVREDVPRLDEQLTAIVSRATARQLASQARVNLAELVVGALEDTTGFIWSEGDTTYVNQDPRRAFYAKLVHPDDSEIVVEVSPDDSGDSYVLRILSYDTGIPDEEERVRRMHAISEELRDRGLKVGTPEAESALPDPALTDIDGLRGSVPTQARLSESTG
jgi:hypothetical protein